MIALFSCHVRVRKGIHSLHAKAPDSWRRGDYMACNWRSAPSLLRFACRVANPPTLNTQESAISTYPEHTIESAPAHPALEAQFKPFASRANAA
ncbi:hypothetical protein [Paraburkholderia acidiphila]|uniref:Uncharacterized protein n=1 Tax=Paraburkholderia acidiphila TaxID=2571747 RepID=A0A7Z2G6T2_9BURK|nr:hypothetical protein [Paraburkholderia acidiphila]QGZ56265.1 hypothetical protein FAZ97_14750 [Paraburkholderia acidiphila]